MAQGTIVPFVSSSTLFNRGIIALCPSLGVLLGALPPAGSRHRLECEWVLELLLRKLPHLPHGGRLGESSAMHPRVVADDRWNEVLARCTVPEIRAFAERSIVAMTDLLLSARTLSRPAASS